MPHIILPAEAAKLQHAGTTLIDILEAHEFAHERIPGRSTCRSRALNVVRCL
jgi:rhodanese-related sulfurtransferase